MIDRGHRPAHAASHNPAGRRPAHRPVHHSRRYAVSYGRRCSPPSQSSRYAAQVGGRARSTPNRILPEEVRGRERPQAPGHSSFRARTRRGRGELPRTASPRRRARFPSTPRPPPCRHGPVHDFASQASFACVTAGWNRIGAMLGGYPHSRHKGKGATWRQFPLPLPARARRCDRWGACPPPPSTPAQPGRHSRRRYPGSGRRPGSDGIEPPPRGDERYRPDKDSRRQRRRGTRRLRGRPRYWPRPPIPGIPGTPQVRRTRQIPKPEGASAPGSARRRLYRVPAPPRPTLRCR